MINNFLVIGAGAWGLALSQLLAKNGKQVYLFARAKEDADFINLHHKHPRYLSEQVIDSSIIAISDIKDAPKQLPILLVIPAQAIEEMLCYLKKYNYLCENHKILVAAKGLESKNGRFSYQLIKDIFSTAKITLLSGPSFAIDVIKLLPTAVTLASTNDDVSDFWMQSLNNKNFRTYSSNKLLTVSLGGVAKNIIAVACGIVIGAQLGNSAHAAVVTRGFAEISRLAKAMNADDVTLRGLSGLGDLVLTCSSPQSRNMSFGINLGKGKSVKQALAISKGVVEGCKSVGSLLKLGNKYKVELPISSLVNKIIQEEISVRDAINLLMDRPLKKED